MSAGMWVQVTWLMASGKRGGDPSGWVGRYGLSTQPSSTPARENPFPAIVLCAYIYKNTSVLLNIKEHEVTQSLELLAHHVQWVGELSGFFLFLFKIPGTEHFDTAFNITECLCRSIWADLASAAASDRKLRWDLSNPLIDFRFACA